MRLVLVARSEHGYVLSPEALQDLLSTGAAEEVPGGIAIRAADRRKPPKPQVPDEPVAAWFVTVEGHRWALTESALAGLSAAYPAVDVRQECKRVLAWLEASRSHLKTYGRMGKFLNGWMGRCQDKGGRSPDIIGRRPMTILKSADQIRRENQERVRRDRAEAARVYDSWAAAPPSPNSPTSPSPPPTARPMGEMGGFVASLARQVAFGDRDR